MCQVGCLKTIPYFCVGNQIVSFLTNIQSITLGWSTHAILSGLAEVEAIVVEHNQWKRRIGQYWWKIASYGNNKCLSLFPLSRTMFGNRFCKYWRFSSHLLHQTPWNIFRLTLNARKHVILVVRLIKCWIFHISHPGLRVTQIWEHRPINWPNKLD